jgi:hypothetical protein
MAELARLIGQNDPFADVAPPLRTNTVDVLYAWIDPKIRYR